MILALIAALGLLGLGVFIGSFIHTGNPSSERPILTIHTAANTSTAVLIQRSGNNVDSGAR